MNPTTTTRDVEPSRALREELHELRIATAETAREKLAKARQALQGKVTEKPFQSLAIAVAAGFAIGWLLRSRRS
jgi:ElaB/YqjD/DUF883 family membrane-anchored ribosome-binding protein